MRERGVAEVRGDQRWRLLAAVPVALADGRGYESVAVQQVLAVAGISRRTFYELFDDRADVFRAAYDEAFGCLYRAAMAAAEACESWSERVTAALGSALGLAADHPRAARMIAVEPLCATPPLRRHHYRSLDRFVPLLREGREERPDGVDLPAALEPTLLAGVSHVVGGRLDGAAVDSLPALGPRLTDLLLAPYR